MSQSEKNEDVKLSLRLPMMDEHVRIRKRRLASHSQQD